MICNRTVYSLFPVLCTRAMILRTLSRMRMTPSSIVILHPFSSSCPREMMLLLRLVAGEALEHDSPATVDPDHGPVAETDSATHCLVDHGEHAAAPWHATACT